MERIGLIILAIIYQIISRHNYPAAFPEINSGKADSHLIITPFVQSTTVLLTR